jgi:hypothetical protein
MALVTDLNRGHNIMTAETKSLIPTEQDIDITVKDMTFPEYITQVMARMDALSSPEYIGSLVYQMDPGVVATKCAEITLKFMVLSLSVDFTARFLLALLKEAKARFAYEVMNTDAATKQ